MTFAERLKEFRKQAGFSQEKLAEKLGVSRQAITKWETGAGVPELENMMAIATLFGVSVDSLLAIEKPQETAGEFLFESVTEYDVDRPKRYDLKLGGAKQVNLAGYDGEKIRVRLASNQLPSLQEDLKVKIDGERDCMDLDVVRKNGLTEAAVKESLTVFVFLPKKYTRCVELAANAEGLCLSDLSCEEIELDVKSKTLSLDGVESKLEVNCNLDMEITCTGLAGTLELNQISATSKLTLPQGCVFRTAVKGLGNSVGYAKNGKPCEDFSTPSAENAVKLNGMHSELVITEA